MTDFHYHAIKEPAIDLGRKNSRSGWWAKLKGAVRVMGNEYERSSSFTKQLILGACVGITVVFVGTLGGTILSHGSRLDKIEQHDIDMDTANAAALQRINDNLNYIRSRMDGGGDHGSRSP